MVVAEDIDLVVQEEENIVAEVTHVPTLAAGQDHHDDHAHIHVVHHLTIGNDKQFLLFEQFNLLIIICCSSSHLFS